MNKDKILYEIEEKENAEKLKEENFDNETISGYYCKNRRNEKEDLDEVNYFLIFFLILKIVTLCCWIWGL